MKKITRIVLLVVFGGLIIIQFFQPEKNLSDAESENDLILSSDLPDTLAVILKISCYDCHSNHTRYPWYSYISPLSWYLNRHTNNGKGKVNFSEWGVLSKKDKIGVYNGIYNEINKETMPLKSYLLIHRRAKLNRDQIDAISEWSGSEALKLLRE